MPHESRQNREDGYDDEADLLSSSDSDEEGLETGDRANTILHMGLSAVSSGTAWGVHRFCIC